MGGTSAANERYLSKDERYPVPQISTPDWWWEVPVPQMSTIWMGMKDTRYRKWAHLTSDGRYQCRKMNIIWMGMKETGTANWHTWLVMGGTSTANEHYLRDGSTASLLYLAGGGKYTGSPVPQISFIWQVMGGTSTAKEHYLNKDGRYQYRKWALSDRWLEVPVPQRSTTWIRMKDTGTAN